MKKNKKKITHLPNYWVRKIKDPIVRHYIRQNIRWISEQPAMHDFLESAFRFKDTPQGWRFWFAIVQHFRYGHGRKTYNDFKHLDKSLKYRR